MRLQSILRYVYFAFFEFSNRPAAFNNIKQLKEVDDLHKTYFRLNENLFKKSKKLGFDRIDFGYEFLTKE